MLTSPESAAERIFYENCHIGDNSYWPAPLITCGVKVQGLSYCSRTLGHAGKRHVAESTTSVLAIATSVSTARTLSTAGSRV